MGANEEFVRARCEATGAIAPLPKQALEEGHIPGWVEVPGPVPAEAKYPAFPEQYEGPRIEPQETDESAGVVSAKKTKE